MNKHYKKALVEATLQKLRDADIQATEAEVSEVANTIDITGNWDADTDTLLHKCISLADEAQYEEEAEYEDGENEEPLCGPLDCVAEEKKAVEARIDEVVGSLKIGYNFIPGIGAGWCSSEEDLGNLRDFVRGALVAQAMNPSI